MRHAIGHSYILPSPQWEASGILDQSFPHPDWQRRVFGLVGPYAVLWLDGVPAWTTDQNSMVGKV